MSAFKSQPKMSIGDVFKKEYSGEYWKVTGYNFPNRFNELGGYQVIKCSKTGKEFKEINGFSLAIDNYIGIEGASYTIIQRATQVGIKADTNGIETGKLKRRAQYLQRKIESYQKELDTILQKLG
jgi:hypothetical protein